MLNKLVDDYNSNLALLDKEGQEYIHISKVELPQARTLSMHNLGMVGNVKKKKECCVNAAEMSELNAKLIQYQQEAEGSTQIVDNLNKRLESIKLNRKTILGGLDKAKKQIWSATATDLLEKINIPDELFSDIEKYVAANCLAGGTSIRLSDSLNSKLGKLDDERRRDVQLSLINEIGIKKPEPLNY